MTRVRKLALILCLLALLLSISGCFIQPESTEPPPTEPATQPTPPPTDPPLTAEGLMAQVIEALDGRTLHQVSADMDLDISVNTKRDGFRFSMDMGMDMNMDLIIGDTPTEMYGDMTMTIDAMGQSQTQRAQLYYQNENDQLVCYVQDLSTGIWTTMEMGEIPDQGSQYGEGSDIPAPELTLDKYTQKVARREVYVLRFTLTEEHLSQFITPVTGSGIIPLAYEPEDPLEGLSAPTVLYIDTETLLPVRVEMDITGLDGLINDLIPEGSGMPSFELSMTATQTEEESTTVIVGTFRIVMTDMSFDPVEIPQIPQEAFDYVAMYDHDPVQEDGSYVIIHLGAAARVTPPADWYMLDCYFDYLCLEHSSQNYHADYLMYPAMTRNEITQTVLKTYLVPLQEYDSYESHTYGPRIGKFDTLCIQDTYGDTMYCAWAPMGEGWILIYVDDYTGNEPDIEGVLTSLIEAVSEQEPVN